MKFIRTTHVSRQQNGDYWIHWTPEFSSSPVTIFVSENPEAVTSIEPLLMGVIGGVTLPDLPTDKRHYFYLRAEDGAAVKVAERLLPLEGGKNFRDCGGYPAAAGRRVKWNRLYRSGYMSNLSNNDVRYLGNLGIKICCDFRAETEQQNEPSLLPESTQIISLTIDPGSITSYMELAAAKAADLPAMSDVMAKLNLNFVENHTEQYGAMLSQLIQLEEGAFLINCSAGKDRTGFGVALILIALGVSREVIMHDYLLSHKYFSAKEEMPRLLKKYAASTDVAISEEMLMPMLEARESYLGTALDYIEKEYGTPEQYLLQKFSIDNDMLTDLRNRFTE